MISNIVLASREDGCNIPSADMMTLVSEKLQNSGLLGMGRVGPFIVCGEFLGCSLSDPLISSRMAESALLNLSDWGTKYFLTNVFSYFFFVRL